MAAGHEDRDRIVYDYFDNWCSDDLPPGGAILTEAWGGSFVPDDVHYMNALSERFGDDEIVEALESLRGEQEIDLRGGER